MAQIITVYDRYWRPVAEVNTADEDVRSLSAQRATVKDQLMLAQHPEPVAVCPTCRRVQ